MSEKDKVDLGDSAHTRRPMSALAVKKILMMLLILLKQATFTKVYLHVVDYLLYLRPS